MSGFFKNKKGNAVLDTATIIVILLVFSLVTILGYNVWDDLMPTVRADINNTQANETLNTITDDYPSLFDGAFVFVFVGIWIVGLVASFMIDSHPIFFAVALILLSFVIVSSIYFGNFFEETIQDTEFSDMAAHFPMTIWIMTHLLTVSIVIGSSILIVLYAKTRFG